MDYNALQEDTRDRVNRALRDYGERSHLSWGFPPIHIGQFTLKHQTAVLRIELKCRDNETPSFELADMNSSHTNKGHGRIALMKLFDIADRAEIENISVCASKIGVTLTPHIMHDVRIKAGMSYKKPC